MEDHSVLESLECLPVVEGGQASDACGVECCARSEYWRRAALDARSRAGSLSAILRSNRKKLEGSRREYRELCRRAKGALSAVAEAERLQRILDQHRVDTRRRSTLASLRQENGELRCEVEALREDNEHLRRVLSDEAQAGRLEGRIAELERRLSLLKAMRSNEARHRYGDRSERGERPGSVRRRGQQVGCAGPGRTPRGLLPVRVERVEMSDAHCEQCGQALVGHGWVQSDLVEIEVSSHVRRIRRRRYRRGCGCSGVQTLTAPPAARLFANTAYGISVYKTLVLERFEGQRPLRQIVRWMAGHGIRISAGALGDRLGDLSRLFEPLSQAIREQLITARVLQGDETPWRVQQRRRDGESARAWLWVGQSRDAVWFHIDAHRSLDAALTVFKGVRPGSVLLSDRYVSYVSVVDKLNLVPAFCWAHARRDFVECEGAVDTPFKSRWLSRIASIYRIHRRRGRHDPSAGAFAREQQALAVEVKALFSNAEAELADYPAPHPRAEPLRRLLDWRHGLERFVTDPEVPIDNNACERILRAPVIARKLSFGNDSWTGARLSAHLYSVLATLKLHRIDLEHWMHEWLSACATAHSAPSDLTPWLPWSMDTQRRKRLQQPRASPHA